MKVTPRTENEIAALNLLPNGWYPFTISDAEEKTSKAGNEMIVLNVRVYSDRGSVFIKDFLMDTEFGAGKLRSCAETCGQLEAYESGRLSADDLDGREGFARVGIEKSKDSQFPDKNKIWMYAKEKPKPKGEETKATSKAPALSDPPEDDIPF